MTNIGIKPFSSPTAGIQTRTFSNFESGSNVVFFGNSLGVECQRCGAFCSTSNGHKYCTHVTCPIALKEFKRRRRKRTSTLEQVYIPQKFKKAISDVQKARSQ